MNTRHAWPSKNGVDDHGRKKTWQPEELKQHSQKRFHVIGRKGHTGRGFRTPVGASIYAARANREVGQGHGVLDTKHMIWLGESDFLRYAWPDKSGKDGHGRDGAKSGHKKSKDYADNVDDFIIQAAEDSNSGIDYWLDKRQMSRLHKIVKSGGKVRIVKVPTGRDEADRLKVADRKWKTNLGFSKFADSQDANDEVREVIYVKAKKLRSNAERFVDLIRAAWPDKSGYDDHGRDGDGDDSPMGRASKAVEEGDYAGAEEHHSSAEDFHNEAARKAASSEEREAHSKAGNLHSAAARLWSNVLSLSRKADKEPGNSRIVRKLGHIEERALDASDEAQEASDEARQFKTRHAWPDKSGKDKHGRDDDGKTTFVKGQPVKFHTVADEGDKEARFHVIEDNGDRVVIQNIHPLTPTSRYRSQHLVAKSDLTHAWDDTEPLEGFESLRRSRSRSRSRHAWPDKSGKDNHGRKEGTGFNNPNEDDYEKHLIDTTGPKQKQKLDKSASVDVLKKKVFGKKGTWEKRGGHPNAALEALHNRLTKAGFVKVDTTSDINADGSYVTNTTLYRHPKGPRAKIAKTIGPTKLYNHFTAEIIPGNPALFEKAMKKSRYAEALDLDLDDLDRFATEEDDDDDDLIEGDDLDGDDLIEGDDLDGDDLDDLDGDDLDDLDGDDLDGLDNDDPNGDDDDGDDEEDILRSQGRVMANLMVETPGVRELRANAEVLMAGAVRGFLENGYEIETLREGATLLRHADGRNAIAVATKEGGVVEASATSLQHRFLALSAGTAEGKDTTKETDMNKTERDTIIKALAECPHSGFTSDDTAYLATLSDDRLNKLKADTDARTKVLAEAAKPRTLSETEFLAAAPESIRNLVNRAAADEKNQRETFIKVLSESQTAFSKERLEAMSTDDLRALAEVTKAPVNFAALGVSRAATEITPTSTVAPRSYDEALKARK